MTRPYSNDLRERVVAMAQSSPNRATGTMLGVSAASVSRWCSRKRETGSVAPAKVGGYRKPILLSEREWLVARLEAAPDITLRALLAELGERGIEVSYGALWNYLEREGFSFKKNRVRQRAGSPGDSQAASSVAKVSGPSRP
jgi:transposase